MEFSVKVRDGRLFRFAGVKDYVFQYKPLLVVRFENGKSVYFNMNFVEYFGEGSPT